METAVKFTDGKISIKGNAVSKEKSKRADYILYINANNPIAIIEAKDNKHFVSAGLQQAMAYAKMMNIPFAYSSNGDAFIEHDFLTGQEKEIPLNAFPTYDELCKRYKAEANDGKGLCDSENKIINQPYYTGQKTFPPRYYQRSAINKTVEAIARGQKRLLLVMATGTGKIYTAFQIVYRLLKAGLKRKVLYLADRNILVDQSISQDFRPFKGAIHKINFANDDAQTISAYEVYFSLYQQLADRESKTKPEQEESEQDEEETISKLQTLFSPDFFDLVIVDECHRGSVKKDSNWRKILEYFSSATQIGMTATPKETEYISNIYYFGEPVYTYSLKRGIDDGFLAPFRVIKVTTDISNGWRPCEGQTDINGDKIENRIYTNNDYDYNIVIEDRINQVAKKITDYLKNTDRMAKTIVFCATEEHADIMRSALNNLNADMSKENSDYIVRITGSDKYGKKKLESFISVNEKYPVIATTSKLLSTGVDCKMVKLIVIDQRINTMTEFKQIIGRGTRLLRKKDKTHFTIMDFRDVTRHFSDPDWDGPIEIAEGFNPEHEPKPRGSRGSVGRQKKYYVDVDGCQVSIINEIVSVYDNDGKLLRQENIIDYTKKNIMGEYASLDNFIKQWSKEEKKENIGALLSEHGIDLEALKKEQGMSDVDDFDFICHVAFDKKPLTRRERANNVKKHDFLNKYSDAAREVLEALLDKYMNLGICEIESTNILRLDPLTKFGVPSKIVSYFGGLDGYKKAIKELETEIYKVA